MSSIGSVSARFVASDVCFRCLVFTWIVAHRDPVIKCFTYPKFLGFRELKEYMSALRLAFSAFPQTAI